MTGARGFGVVSLGWIAYLPVPFLAVLPALLQKNNRNTRFHAWQGGLLVLLLWIALIIFGLILRNSDSSTTEVTVGTFVLVALILYLIGALVGGIAAVADKYTRVRPVYDILSLFRKG